MLSADNIEIGVADLRDLIAGGADIELIDVREPWEVSICRIARSRPIPLAELPHRTTEVNRETTTVMICHHGMRSLRATKLLRQIGFANVVNLAGGIDAWAEQIEPNMARY